MDERAGGKKPIRWILLAWLVLITAAWPTAQALPSDQTWLAGIYDDADLDTLIFTLTTAKTGLGSPISVASPLPWPVFGCADVRAVRPVPHVPTPCSVRAPPGS